jgi:hypothetical protein
MTIEFYDDEDDDLLMEELGDAIDEGRKLGVLEEDDL